MDDEGHKALDRKMWKLFTYILFVAIILGLLGILWSILGARA